MTTPISSRMSNAALKASLSESLSGKYFSGSGGKADVIEDPGYELAEKTRALFRSSQSTRLPMRVAQATLDILAEEFGRAYKLPDLEEARRRIQTGSEYVDVDPKTSGEFLSDRDYSSACLTLSWVWDLDRSLSEQEVTFFHSLKEEMERAKNPQGTFSYSKASDAFKKRFAQVNAEARTQALAQKEYTVQFGKLLNTLTFVQEMGGANVSEFDIAYHFLAQHAKDGTFQDLPPLHSENAQQNTVYHGVLGALAFVQPHDGLHDFWLGNVEKQTQLIHMMISLEGFLAPYRRGSSRLSRATEVMGAFKRRFENGNPLRGLMDWEGDPQYGHESGLVCCLSVERDMTQKEILDYVGNIMGVELLPQKEFLARVEIGDLALPSVILTPPEPQNSKWKQIEIRPDGYSKK